MITGTETVTIIRRALGATDEYGIPTETVTEIEMTRVLVGFGSTSEPVSAEADPQNLGITLYFPSGTVIEQNDEFIIRGERFVKNGRAMDWVSPFSGFDAGVVVPVRQHLG